MPTCCRREQDRTVRRDESLRPLVDVLNSALDPISSTTKRHDSLASPTRTSSASASAAADFKSRSSSRPRPPHRGQMPSLISLDLSAAADPAGSFIDRRQRVRGQSRSHCPPRWSLVKQSSVRPVTLIRRPFRRPLTTWTALARFACKERSRMRLARRLRRTLRESGTRLGSPPLPLRAAARDRPVLASSLLAIGSREVCSNLEPVSAATRVPLGVRVACRA